MVVDLFERDWFVQTWCEKSPVANQNPFGRHDGCNSVVHTVDGRNSAPVDIMENIPLFTGFYTSNVVQDFFHQQYVHPSFW